MPTLGENEIFIFIAQLGVIIFAARLCGEIAKRLGQPILVGEVIAGILLGPLVFGRLFPEFRDFLFPTQGVTGYILQGISWLCAIFLLLITGLEIDFQASLQYGKQNILTSLFGFLFPFLGIFCISKILPPHFFPAAANPVFVGLLLATSLSVSSVPVIGKILFDLKIFHSNVGLNIITSSVLSDIWEWSTLLMIIALATKGTVTALSVVQPIIIMFLLIGLALSAGQRFLEKIYQWLNIEPKDTAAILAFLFAMTLLNSAIAHLLGIHVAFGAFLTGLMIGESNWITPAMRQSIQDFIFAVFAPIFFVLIGMQLQFNFAGGWLVVILLMAVASAGKVSGAFLGALLGGMGRKNAFAVGCGVNAPGAMGIVVALIGADMGLFHQELFSVIVLICVLSALLVGPTLKWATKGLERPLAKFFERDHIFVNVHSANKRDLINTMVKLMAQRNIIQDPDDIRRAIWSREESLGTGIGEGIALPHARLPNLRTPIVCFFKLTHPIEFNSPDNIPVQLVFLELTNSNDNGMQLNLIAQISRFLSSAENKRKLLQSTNEEEIHHALSFDATA